MIQTLAVFIVTVERDSAMGSAEQYTDRYKIDLNDTPYPRQDTPPEEQPNTVMLSEHAGSGYAPLETVPLNSITPDNETPSEEGVVEKFRNRLDDYLNEDEVVDVEVTHRTHDISWQYNVGG